MPTRTPPPHPAPAPSPAQSSAPWRTWLGASLAIAVLAGLVALFAGLQGPRHITHRLLIAPMMGGLGSCLHGEAAPPHLADDPAYRQCQTQDGSAAPVIEATLASLTQGQAVNSAYTLGYTLHAPLLKFFRQQDRGGDWVIDTAAVERLAQTIAQTPRQVVLYLFSTHFSAEAAIEPVLAADPANMAVHPQGVMGKDTYYGMDVYPWSIARTDNGITHRRLQAIEAISTALCRQPAAVRARILGITLLGETHHHFPGFEAGMGFGGPHEVSDYSETSVRNFRAFLLRQFGSIAAINQALASTGAQFADVNAVFPPAKPLLQDSKLPGLDARQPMWTHWDAYAAGRFPVSGWLAPSPSLTGRVIVVLDGRELARVRAGLGRQDVLFQLPALGTADVGWRHDIDFRTLAAGPHQVVVLAEAVQGPPQLLDQRTITVVPALTTLTTGQAPAGTPALPAHQTGLTWTGHLDEPRPGARYLHNPLASLWQDFRRQQVVDYLQHMARPLQAGCLAGVPRYVHQLIPFPNPSWDEGKYAIERSLDRSSGFELGVSLYGEAGYGHSFFGWKERHRQGGYGVTEFHPLRGMDAEALTQVLAEHRRHGARFLSFFMEPHGLAHAPATPQVANFLSFDAANPAKGSDQLFTSMQRLLTAP